MKLIQIFHKAHKEKEQNSYDAEKGADLVASQSPD